MWFVWLWVVSAVGFGAIWVWDGYWYPVCPSCLTNLNSQRMGFGTKAARCSQHGAFLIGYSYKE